jgi:hypothetical protein
MEPYNEVQLDPLTKEAVMRLVYFLVIAVILGWAADPPSGPSATTLPPVYFNHVTMYVDPAVYSAITSAAVLNDLAGFHESTTQRDRGTWSYKAFYAGSIRIWG